MKRLVLLLPVVMVLLVSAPWAWSQDEVMKLEIEELSPYQRPMVVFNHGKHSEELACVRCHHDYDKLLNNTGGEEGGNCADCHERTASADNPVPLRSAFHRNCKSCHQTLRDRGVKSGPVTCGACHVRGAAQKVKTD